MRFLLPDQQHYRKQAGKTCDTQKNFRSTWQKLWSIKLSRKPSLSPSLSTKNQLPFFTWRVLSMALPQEIYWSPWDMTNRLILRINMRPNCFFFFFPSLFWTSEEFNCQLLAFQRLWIPSRNSTPKTNGSFLLLTVLKLRAISW